jgi:dTDP-D-glucose 4,6-dehydratase
MRKLTNILVTDGTGFIGVNFIRFLFGETEKKQDFNG